MAKRYEAPKYLPEGAKKKWNGLYTSAFNAAKSNFPDDEPAQHTAAHKAANKMLAVEAPEDADDIDSLEDWEVTMRDTKTIDGVPHRVCVTIDGRKYAHPLPPAKAKQQ